MSDRFKTLLFALLIGEATIFTTDYASAMQGQINEALSEKSSSGEKTVEKEIIKSVDGENVVEAEESEKVKEGTIDYSAYKDIPYDRLKTRWVISATLRNCEETDLQDFKDWLQYEINSSVETGSIFFNGFHHGQEVWDAIETNKQYDFRTIRFSEITFKKGFAEKLQRLLSKSTYYLSIIDCKIEEGCHYSDILHQKNYLTDLIIRCDDLDRDDALWMMNSFTSSSVDHFVALDGKDFRTIDLKELDPMY